MVLDFEERHEIINLVSFLKEKQGYVIQAQISEMTYSEKFYKAEGVKKLTGWFGGLGFVLVQGRLFWVF